jgi:Fic family protein
MFVPEYTITGKILENIGTVEYGKAIVETTTILPNWQKQLEKERKVSLLYNTLSMEGIRVDINTIKRCVDGLSKNAPKELEGLNSALELLDEISEKGEFGEEDLIQTYKEMSAEAKRVTYRDIKIPQKPLPEEILAQMVELMDWYNSLDSMETHPILRAGILKAQIEQITPFKKHNQAIANYASLLSLKISGYDIKGYICLENFYTKSKAEHDKQISSIPQNDGDLTQWLEFYTEAFSNEVSNTKEKVLLLARDTKIAKVSGRAKLTPRQEKIVEYLQDYGILQNRSFATLFPNISEDSVLRDLKVLVKEGVVVKRGKTKNSRYELR